MITLSILEDNYDYNQITQSTALEFSFAYKEGDDYEQIVAPFSCREFFGCLILASELGERTEEFFGMEARPIPDYDGFVYMTLSFGSNEERSCCLNSLPLIHSIEEELGLNKAEVIGVDGRLTVILKIDEYWMKAPLLAQAYSYILRLFCHDCIGAEGNHTKFQHYSSLEDILIIFKRDYETRSGSSDSYIAKELLNWNVSLTKLLLNSKEIFKNEPLTGWNDKEYLKKVVDDMDGDSSFCVSRDERRVRLNRSSVHSYSGLVSFAENVQDGRSSDGYNGYGATWVREYLRLI